MPVAHPYLGLLRKFLQHRFVDFDRPAVVPELREDGCLQIAIAGIAWFFCEQALNLCQSGRRLSLPIKYHRVVVAGRIETRCELQTLFE